MDDYVFKYVRGEHIEVFLHGIFQFSADNISEARYELKQMIGCAE